MTHFLGKMEQDSVRFHHADQNGTHLKAYELFTSRISHLVFSDPG